MGGCCSWNKNPEPKTDRTQSLGYRPYYGLINQGATCYLNTVLQCLYMTKEFRKEVKSFIKGPQDNQGNTQLLKHLQNLFENLEQGDGRTEDITQSLSIRNVYEQQDAVEYYQKILKAVGPTSKVFEGTLSNNSKCEDGHLFQKRSSFITVPLAIEAEHDEVYIVEEGLEAFFKHTKLDEDNWLYCDQCEQKRESDTWIDIEEFPTVLTLHLKRFDFDYMCMQHVKNHSPVDIPLSLHIKGHSYELYSVINHRGDRNGGHYNAVIKPFEETRWYCFDDSSVQQESEHSLLQSRLAYLLMYRKGFSQTRGFGLCESLIRIIWKGLKKRGFGMFNFLKCLTQRKWLPVTGVSICLILVIWKGLNLYTRQPNPRILRSD